MRFERDIESGMPVRISEIYQRIKILMNSDEVSFISIRLKYASRTQRAPDYPVNYKILSKLKLLQTIENKASNSITFATTLSVALSVNFTSLIRVDRNFTVSNRSMKN